MRARSRSRTPMMTWSMPAIPLRIAPPTGFLVDLTTEARRTQRRGWTAGVSPAKRRPGRPRSNNKLLCALCVSVVNLNSQDSVLVDAGAHLACWEGGGRRDPGEGFLVHLFGVGLEDEPLARAPAPRVDLVTEAGREFLAVIMGIEVRPQIDVALRPAERAEIFAHILRVGIAGDERGHHKRRVDDLAETELFHEVVGSAEQGGGRHLAVDQQFHAAEQEPVDKGQLDVLRLQILLQGLDRRVMAARLVPDRDRYAGEIGGVLDVGVRRHKDRGGGHRIGVGVELAVADRGGDIDGPVTGAADVAVAAALKGPIGADLVAEIVDPAGRGRRELVAELAIEPFVPEIALVARHPFMEAHMRRYDEFRHVFLPKPRPHLTLAAAPAGSAASPDRALIHDSDQLALDHRLGA